MLFFSWSVDWKLRWLSFLSVLSVFVDSPFWIRLREWYRYYYLYSVVCRDIQGSKRPNTIKLLFQIQLSYFEELKKKQQQQNRTYRSPLLTEELLEKLMLAKTKHKNLCKFYWNPFRCLGRVMDNATVSFLSCIVLSIT